VEQNISPASLVAAYGEMGCKREIYEVKSQCACRQPNLSSSAPNRNAYSTQTNLQLK